MNSSINEDMSLNLPEQRGDALALPKVSIITACYNSAEVVGCAIQSVNEQNYPHIEHIFVDGASQDGTCAAIGAASTRPNKIISEPDKGIYDALNKGICHASGDIIGLLHADDFLVDDKVVDDIVQAFKDPSVDAVFGDLQYVRRDDLNRTVRYWKTKPFSKGRLSRGWMPPHPTLYVRKDWYQRSDSYDQTYTIAADYLYILQLFSNDKFKSVYIPRVLVKMRTGGTSNRSIRNILAKSLQDYRVLRASGLGGIKTVILKNARKIRQFF